MPELGNPPVIEALRNEIAIGQILAEKFRVESVLGQGGMGLVLSAHHLVLDEPVALKFLLPEGAQNPEAVVRFEREAKAAAKIRSEHVTRVSDVGRLPSGTPYLVMELLRGSDLGEVLEAGGPLPLEDVVDYVLQAGEAIAEAHTLGIVHRDLKPSNLFLTRRADGSTCVKVLDFGISKWTGPGAEQSLTRTATMMGSPPYMSPEQLLSARNVDQRTDIWSLGVICYELLTGNRPFEAETLPQLCMEITHAEPKPLRVWRPDLPAAFEQLVQRCLEKDAKKRLSSVAELARELVNFAPKRSQLSAERIERMSRADGRVAQEPKAVISAPGIASASTRTAKRQTRGAFGHTESAPSTPRSRSLVVGIALLAAGGASVLLFTQQAPSNEPVIASMSITPEPAAASVFINKPPLPVEQPNAAASGLTAQSATAAASLPVAAASSPLQSISRKPPGVPQRQRQSLGVPPNSTPAKKAGASGAKPERGELGGRL